MRGCQGSAVDAKFSFCVEVNIAREGNTTGRSISMGNFSSLEKMLLIMIGRIFLDVVVNIFLLLIVTE